MLRRRSTASSSTRLISASASSGEDAETTTCGMSVPLCPASSSSDSLESLSVSSSSKGMARVALLELEARPAALLRVKRPLLRDELPPLTLSSESAEELHPSLAGLLVRRLPDDVEDVVAEPSGAGETRGVCCSRPNSAWDNIALKSGLSFRAINICRSCSSERAGAAGGAAAASCGDPPSIVAGEEKCGVVLNLIREVLG
mmetsp:Transcript_34725/g.88889  ORF Transcript_34725/g.88889 Transcript_34725/m.88889 type:complete len:201 (+) Transcript_34725:1216-1818(+)